MSKIRLEQISIYPIKSTSGIHLSNSWVDELGLSFDRRFVLSDPQGQFITARTNPKLCLIQASLTTSGLKLTAPDMPVLTVNYQDFSKQYQQVQVWKDSIQAQASPDSYNLWFSQYLGKACRLMYFGQQSQRSVKNKNNSKKIKYTKHCPTSILFAVIEYNHNIHNENKNIKKVICLL